MKIIIDARTHASITKSSRNFQEEHFFYYEWANTIELALHIIKSLNKS